MINVLLFSDQKEGTKIKPYKGVYLIAEKQFEVLAPSPFPEDIVKVLIKSSDPKWRKGFNILRTSEEFIKYIQKKPGYVVAFKILSHDVVDEVAEPYNPLDEPHKDSANVSCNFKYIHTHIDLNSKTFMESIQNKKYKQNECWINSITDFYGDTLMNTDRKRNKTTTSKFHENK